MDELLKDKRALFFLGSAILCALLIPTALPEFRYVGKILAVAQAILGLLSLADSISRRKPRP